jgi:hypothetical protein
MECFGDYIAELRATFAGVPTAAPEIIELRSEIKRRENEARALIQLELRKPSTWVELIIRGAERGVGLLDLVDAITRVIPANDGHCDISTEPGESPRDSVWRSIQEALQHSPTAGVTADNQAAQSAVK